MANLLVVDDDAITLQIVSALLRKEGHSVQTATDAYAALDLLDKEFFHLMITDANMPKISGYNLVATLRRSLKHQNLPIIFMTGRREKTDVMRALKTGVGDYVIKPVELPILSEKINGLLSSKSYTPPNEKVATHVAAVFSLKMDVIEVSEQGLLLTSPHALPMDFKFHVESEIFHQLNIKPATLRVVGCEMPRHDPGPWQVRAHFADLSKEDRETVSAWIHGKKKSA